MSEVHLLVSRSVKDREKIRIFEAKKRLSPCPICGAKAYISKDIVDGFYFGWSVGCPRFCFNDGIHGINENSPEEDHLSIMCLDSASECVDKWNKKVEKIKAKRGNEDGKQEN